MKNRLITKWVCRLILLILTAALSYVVILPSYNFSHWVPHTFLRSAGVNYSSILWAEQNADVALHFLGAVFLTLLLYGSSLPILNKSLIRPFIFVSFLCVAAEIAQHIVGRGMQTSDLLLGICGSFMAYLGKYIKNKQMLNLSK